MYFPHIELLFLLFVYQGASAAEAQMVTSNCLPLVIIGVFAMVSSLEFMNEKYRFVLEHSG